MNRRGERLASEMTRAVQQVLSRGLNDPRVRGLITVTGVELIDEMRRARVRVSILPEDRQNATLAGLKAATPHVWRGVAALVNTRSLPSIEFVLDATLKKQAKVLGALAQVRAEDERTPPGNEQEGSGSSAEEGTDAER